MSWRTGTKIHQNVYDGNRPVCQTHYVMDARHIVDAVNTQTGRIKAAVLKARREESQAMLGVLRMLRHSHEHGSGEAQYALQQVKKAVHFRMRQAKEANAKP